MGQNSCLFAVRVQIQPKVQQVDKELVPVAEPKTEPEHDQAEEPISDPAETESQVEAVEEGSANKRSEYFVYCNRCEDYEEGKLRVRCDTCLSGAFLVFRAPESWDDVLKPKQVNNDRSVDVLHTRICIGPDHYLVFVPFVPGSWIMRNAGVFRKFRTVLFQMCGSHNYWRR